MDEKAMRKANFILVEKEIYDKMIPVDKKDWKKCLKWQKRREKE